MNERPDIFDKIMSLRIFRFAEPFYKKHKSILLYLLFGGLSFFLNIGLFILLDKAGLYELINNIICWVVCVLFQFWTNRIWVFDAKTESTSQFAKQLLDFFAGRIFTLIIEEAILLVFIEILSFNSLVVKIIGQIVVIVLNYVISKLLVFKKKNNSSEN